MATMTTTSGDAEEAGPAREAKVVVLGFLAFLSAWYGIYLSFVWQSSP